MSFFSRITSAPALRAASVCVMGLALTALPAAQNATQSQPPPPSPRSQSGKSLEVPAKLASQGTVYHALPGRDRQIFFESDAPLEQIKGQSNQVVGYVVSGPADHPERLAGGEWRVPVTSLRTGIELRDEHLASADWLDAGKYPDILFRLDAVSDTKQEKRAEGFSTWSGAAKGTLTIHGVSRPIEIKSASLTFLEASAATAKVAKGNLVAIRVSYSVKLSDFGVSHSVIGTKVSDVVQIENILYMSTVPPEKQ